MKTLLLIDDQPINVHLLKRMTERVGYRAMTAGNGPDGIALARQYHPDLILLDHMMPEMSGTEVCRSLKSDSATSDIPIIMISARSSKEARLEAFAAGVIDFITKPIDLDETLARLSAHYQIKARIDELKDSRTAGKETIERTIEFPPEHKSSGVSILSYFAEFLEATCPGSEAQVSISQLGNRITLRVLTRDGTRHIVERALTDYGEIITGTTDVRKVLSNEADIIALQNKLEVAALELRLSKQVGETLRSTHESRIRSLEDEISFLKNLVAAGVSERNELLCLIQDTLRKPSASEDVAQIMESVKDLLFMRETDENIQALRQQMLLLQKKDRRLYDHIVDITKNTIAGISATVISPWVLSVLNGLPR